MKLFSKFNKHITIIFLVTALLLLIPFITMQFTNEVEWQTGDFVIAAVLLIGTGLTYELIAGRLGNIKYKAAVGIAVGASLLLIWVNLAVGIIGSEDNPANIMYTGVIAVGVLGAIITQFQPKKMSFVLFTMAAVQVLVPVIALIIWKPQFEIEALGVFALNAFFAILFIGSGFLFKQAAKEIAGINNPLTSDN